MITVKETVRRMLIQWPMLFRNKSDCFNHLFLTIGNGYEWVDGCLVDRFADPNDDQPHWSDETGESNSGLVSGIPEIEERLKQHRILEAKRENAQIQLVLEIFDAFFDEHVAFRNPYPPSEYSDLFHMPDDVQPDWRHACREASLALQVWLKQEQRSRLPLEPVIAMNREFRQKHFAAEDARMAEITKGILSEG
jgi:hypothetical protein